MTLRKYVVTLPESKQVHPISVVGNFKLYKEIEYQNVWIILPSISVAPNIPGEKGCKIGRQRGVTDAAPCGYHSAKLEPSAKLHIHSSNFSSRICSAGNIFT